MKFLLIPSEALHAHWTYVRKGLERIKEVSAERWIPEDIFTHLRIKRANLYLGFDGDHCRGFFVLEALKPDPFTNEPYLNVWVLWAEPTTGEHFAGVSDFVGETLTYIDGVAKSLGAKWIRCDGRKGWERYLGGAFKAQKVVYERAVG